MSPVVAIKAEEFLGDLNAARATEASFAGHAEDVRNFADIVFIVFTAEGAASGALGFFSGFGFRISWHETILLRFRGLDFC